MRRRLGIWFVIGAFAFGCAARPEPEPPSAPPAKDFPRTVTDSFGHAVTLPSRPVRIVSTAPSNTEILFAVGVGAQVVGVTTFCSFPPEASQCEKIGGFSPKSISAERIVALRPDLVLTTGRIQQPLTESLRQVGLPVLSYDAHTLEEVIENIRRIGQATGRADDGEKLAAALERRLQSVRNRFVALPEMARPRVLLLISDDPLMTAGPNTFGSQILESAGGRNVFADVTQQFPRISEEEVLKRNPAVIILGQRDDLAVRKALLAKRAGWNQIDAIRNERVLGIEDDPLNRPGPRLFDVLERLADLLHPSGDRGKQ